MGRMLWGECCGENDVGRIVALCFSVEGKTKRMLWGECCEENVVGRMLRGECCGQNCGIALLSAE